MLIRPTLVVEWLDKGAILNIIVAHMWEEPQSQSV
jgi:hypothetical protein